MLPTALFNDDAVAYALVLTAQTLDELAPPRQITPATLQRMEFLRPILDVVVRGDFRRFRRQRVSRRLCGAVCGIYAIFGTVLETGELAAEQWQIVQSIRGPLDWFVECVDKLKEPLEPIEIGTGTL